MVSNHLSIFVGRVVGGDCFGGMEMQLLTSLENHRVVGGISHGDMFEDVLDVRAAPERLSPCAEAL